MQEQAKEAMNAIRSQNQQIVSRLPQLRKRKIVRISSASESDLNILCENLQLEERTVTLDEVQFLRDSHGYYLADPSSSLPTFKWDDCKSEPQMTEAGMDHLKKHLSLPTYFQMVNVKAKRTLLTLQHFFP